MLSAKTNQDRRRHMQTAAVAVAGCCLLAMSMSTNDSFDSTVRRSLKWVSLDSDPLNTGHTRTKGGRKFLGYTSSAWEEHWLVNLEEWQTEESICEHILSDTQWPQTMRFLEATCTHYPIDPTSPWCRMDDGYNYKLAFYNRETGAFAMSGAKELEGVEFEEQARPLAPTPDYDDIFSKFTYREQATGNTYDEYIEPLVSHLRHPLAQCSAHPLFASRVLDSGDVNYPLVVQRSYLLPPPPRTRTSAHDASHTQRDGHGKTYLFDAGASNWIDGAGGPSLSVLTELWKRNGMHFDEIRAFEGSTPSDAFYGTVPNEWKDKTFYKQAYIRSSPDKAATTNATLDGPFLPTLIRETTTKDDYVVFKLDIDSPEVEAGTILYLLSDAGVEDLSHIDELFWEHHVKGNYLMTQYWGSIGDDVTIRQSAEYFLKLRQKGVRAHSWV